MWRAYLSFYPDIASCPYAVGMEVRLSDDVVEIRLARWQKVLGLMGDISVARQDVSEVEVLEKPLRKVFRNGIMAGLRIPGLYYVARTIRLDQAWIVRRGVPALSFSVSNHRLLKRVVVSTPGAAVLAQQLRDHS